MTQTLGDIIKISENYRQAKQWINALKIYRLILESAPFDCEFRLNICDAIMALGYQEYAVRAYEHTSKFCARAGYPLLSITAAKKFDAITGAGDSLLQSIADLYSAESGITGKTARLAPVDRSLTVRNNINFDYSISADELVRGTVQLMFASAENAPFLPTVPPLPIFSDLSKELFIKLFNEIKLLTVEANHTIISEGEEANTFYMLAKGNVVIRKTSSHGKKIELAHLGEGSIFGEMALITKTPRTATVETISPCELLEFSKEKIERLSSESIVIEAAMERFTRERLISNLLATNPIFQPFDRKQRFELLSRFTAHEVTPGTILIRQGQEGRGIYIILWGQADVIKKENGNEVFIATLGSGDVFGEISLIKDTPTTATVKAATHSTILFLPKEYFIKLTESLPNLKEYFDNLSSERLSKTEKAIQRAKEMENESIVYEDELIMI